MRTILSVLSVLAFCGSILAEDSTAVAPAPVAPAAKAAVAGPTITWSGMGMIRLREDIIQNKDAQDVKRKSRNYSNRLAYKLGAKIQANPQVMFQFDVGNEWYATEIVTGGNYLGNSRALYAPFFNLAFAQWDPGFLHMQAGIVPIKGSATMDLIGCSLLFGKMYYNSVTTSPTYGFHASHLPWGVTANFMHPGLRVGAPIVSDVVKIGVDVFTGISEERKVNTATESAYRENYSAFFNILDIPISYGALTLSPQFVIIVNRNYRDDGFVKDKMDHEIGFGTDAGYKLNDMVAFRAGFGMAMISNENTKRVSTTDTIGVPAYDRQGMNITLGSSIKAGPGKIDLDFNFGTNEDKKITDNLATYQFVDVKYGWGVVKNFVIMPRVRAYFGQVPTAGVTKKDSNIRVWPELMLFGTF
jgi:hypothetical protein